MYAVSAGGGGKLPKNTVTNQAPNANSIVSGITKDINDAYRIIGNQQTKNNIANAQANAIKNAINKNGSNNTPSGAIKSSGGSGVAPNDYGGGYGDYIDYEGIARAQAEAEAARLAELRAAANEAYNRNMARIESSYNNAAGSLRSNYDSTVGRLNAARDKSMGDVNSDAEKSLQEAYINNMLTRKNLNQRLSAMGYNGGATETTMGSLENQYGSSRAGINEAANKSIANLNQTYGDNLAGALQSYNSAMANLNLQRMQLENAAENARNNLEASYRPSTENLAMNQDYVNALKNVLTRQSQYTFNPTEATNNFVAGNAQQAQSAAQGNNYAKYLAQGKLDIQKGKSVNEIVNDIYNGVNAGELGVSDAFDIFSALGISR